MYVDLNPDLVTAAFAELTRAFGVPAPPARIPPKAFLDPPFDDDAPLPNDPDLLEDAFRLCCGWYDPLCLSIRSTLADRFPDEIRYTVDLACKLAGELPIRMMSLRPQADWNEAILALRATRRIRAIADEISRREWVPVTEDAPVVQELKRRCPGFAPDHYRELLPEFILDNFRDGVYGA